eukprot:6176028-Pleurochrysis_carterae.AAC.1
MGERQEGASSSAAAMISFGPMLRLRRLLFLVDARPECSAPATARGYTPRHARGGCTSCMQAPCARAHRAPASSARSRRVDRDNGGEGAGGGGGAACGASASGAETRRPSGDGLTLCFSCAGMAAAAEPACRRHTRSGSCAGCSNCAFAFEEAATLFPRALLLPGSREGLSTASHCDASHARRRLSLSS